MRVEAEARGTRQVRSAVLSARFAPRSIAASRTGERYVVRFSHARGCLNLETAWDDLVHGRITFPNRDIGEGDFIVLRSDGTPIYNMAVVSDDIAMGITIVMRGDDHISNTPKQLLLYRALGAELPEFAHLPMIHGLDGRKLSKRHGARRSRIPHRHPPEAMKKILALWGGHRERNES